MIDRPRFYDDVRPNPFPDRLTVSQVAGMDAILNAWESNHGNADIRWLAYCLATAYRETAATMRPIAEYGAGRGHAYGVPDPVTGQTYYGRGYVQLTWRENYARMGEKLGLDLLHHPDLALVPANAAAVMFVGMIDGDFTGRALCDYFGDGVDDPVGARRIVNGTDHADEIAAVYARMLAALS